MRQTGEIKTSGAHLEMSLKVDVEKDLVEVQEDSCLKTNKKIYRKKFQLKIEFLLPTILIIGYLVYVGFAIYLHPERAVFVCIIFLYVVYIYINKLTKGNLKSLILNAFKKIGKCIKPVRKHAVSIRRVLTIVFVAGILLFLVIDIWDQWEKWIPLGGMTFFVIVSVIFSKHPKKINWTPVIWGMILQFCLGLLILRWELGYTACKFIGDQVTIMLDYTDEGSEFVFGKEFHMHPFAFKVLPVIVYFGAIVSVLYYLGVMQSIIRAVALVLQFVLGTTTIESFATSAHIFFGMAETTIALGPFWYKLTISEIHATMCSGFATVAGLAIAAFVQFGVPAEHIIIASFMSAPAALAIAKISLPETEVSEIKSQNEIKIPQGQETNMLEALSMGASSTIKAIGYIVVNLIAFIAVMAFLNAIVSYFGSLVNYPELSFPLIFSYLFMPLAAAMGIPWSECKVVGEMIGKKIVVNEFLAFADLGSMIKLGSIQVRTGVMATYALCGFGSFGALGIYLGSLTSACPDRRSDFAQIALRALVNGNIACFMTACVTGLLYQDHHTAFETSLVNETLSNTTTSLTSVINTTQSMLL